MLVPGLVFKTSGGSRERLSVSSILMHSRQSLPFASYTRFTESRALLLTIVRAPKDPIEAENHRGIEVNLTTLQTGAR